MSTPSPSAADFAPFPGDWIDLAPQAAPSADTHADADTEAPTGPTLAVKANIAVRGLPRGAGSPALAEDVAEADAPVVAALRAKGYRVLGTTNMHELAFGITSDNAAYSPVTVPGHPDRSAGGSSGGSAAVVARGHADVGLGTDTGGSVSIPAALNGVYGLRPSTGRYPAGGLVGLSFTRDTPGLFARSLAALRAADAAVTGTTPSHQHALSGIRLGVPREFMDDLDPALEAVVRAAMARVGITAELVPVDFSGVLANTRAAEMPVVLWESQRLLTDVAANAYALPPRQAYERLVDGVASPDVRGILQSTLDTPVSTEAYAEALKSTFAAREGYEALLDANALTALFFPTTPSPAPLVAQGQSVSHRGETTDAFGLFTRHTGAGTMLAAPMLTLPAGRTEDGLPVGLTLMGRRGEDEALLHLGQVVDTQLKA